MIPLFYLIHLLVSLYVSYFSYIHIYVISFEIRKNEKLFFYFKIKFHYDSTLIFEYASLFCRKKSWGF